MRVHSVLPTAARLALGLLVGLIAIPAGAATIRVNSNDPTSDAGGCGGRGNACDTIQAGVDNAAAGDTVKISNGVYFENVTIPSGKDRMLVQGGKSAILDPDDRFPFECSTAATPCTVNADCPA